MAKKIQIEIEVNGKMQKATVSAKKLRTALDGVDQKQKDVARSAGQADRNIKGAAQASANGTKNFSKMSQGMGGLVGVYATIAAQIFAVTAAFQLFRAATDFSNLISGQEALGAASGVAYKTITLGIQNATDAQLGYAEAARAAAIGTSAGLSPSQLTELGRAAKNASIALGRDLGDSFDRLVRGVVKAEPEVLDELGIILRLAPATEKYAAGIGKAADELTAFERSQAVANEVLGQAEEKFGLIEAQLDPTVASLNQFLKAFDDVKKSIFEVISGPIATFAKFLSENMFALVGVLSLFGLSIIRTILPNLHQWRKDSTEVVDTNKKKLAELRAELDKTKVKYLEMNASQENMAAGRKTLGANKNAQSGAFGFLAGNTTSKASDNAALKAFKHYNNQTKELTAKNIKVRTGMLRKFTAEQIVQLETLYKQRVIYNKKGLIDFKKTAEARKLKEQELILHSQLLGAASEGMFAKMSAGAGRLLGALGWVGLIVSLSSILIGLGKSVYEFFNPIDEKQKEVNEKVDQTIEKYKTLNEELERTNSFLNTTAVSGTQTILAKASQVQSLDVKTLIKDINSLQDPTVRASDNYDDLRKKLLETTKTAAGLDDGLKSLASAVQNDTALTSKNIEEIEAAARAQGNLKAAFTQTAAVTQTTDAAIKSLIDTVRQPFGAEALIAIGTELDSLALKIGELSRIVSVGAVVTVEGKKEIDAEKKKLADLKAQFKKDGRKATFNDDTGILTYLSGGKATRGTNTNQKFLDEYNNTLKNGNALQDEHGEAARIAFEMTEKQLKVEQDRQNLLILYQSALAGVVEENRSALNTSNKALLEAEQSRTNGLTLAGRLANIDADATVRAQSTVKLQNKLNSQKAIEEKLTNKKADKSVTLNALEQEQLDTASQSVKQTEHEINLLKARNALAAAMDPILKERERLQDAINRATTGAQIVQFQQKLNKEATRTFELTKKIRELKDKEDMAALNESASIAKARNPFLDKQKHVAEQTYALQLESHKRKEKQIAKEYANAVIRINLEYDLLEKQKEVEIKKLEALKFDAKNKYGEESPEVSGIAELIKGFSEVNYGPARTAALELARASKDASEANLDRALRGAKRLAIELQPISVILNDAAESFSTALGDSFNTIFDSLNDKTMDLNEALKEIGRDFVKSLQKSFIDNLLVGPITESIGNAFADLNLKEKAANLLGIKSENSTIDPVTGKGGSSLEIEKLGLDGMGLGASSAKPVFVTVVDKPLAGAIPPPESDMPPGVESAEGKIEEQTIATKENTLATTQAGLQTASLAVAGLATFAALTGNEKAAKALAKVMALLQLAVLSLEVVMYVNTGTGFFRRGGIATPPGYSTGGIAKGSHAGYPAILHGTEAVVPLPNGKSIPVDMSGGGGGMQQNNVNVNVVINQDGSTETDSSNDGARAGNLGKTIARAVQNELHNQKRAGGILSPYGAA